MEQWLESALGLKLEKGFIPFTMDYLLISEKHWSILSKLTFIRNQQKRKLVLYIL